jgi:predicted DNA-binding transcriptional regulator AlpA
MSRPARTISDSAAYPPRGMRGDRAAAYLGMSETTFLRLVAEKVFPPGIPIKGIVVWDRYDLDNAFENLKTGAVKKRPRNSMDELLGISDDEES